MKYIRSLTRAPFRALVTTAPLRAMPAIGSVVECGDADFTATLKEAGRTPLIVDFYADWCGPCRMLDPILKKAVAESGTTVLVKVNVDTSQEVASKYQIASLPTVACFKEGKVVDQFIGLRNEAAVRAFISTNAPKK